VPVRPPLSDPLVVVRERDWPPPERPFGAPPPERDPPDGDELPDEDREVLFRDSDSPDSDPPDSDPPDSAPPDSDPPDKPELVLTPGPAPPLIIPAGIRRLEGKGSLDNKLHRYFNRCGATLPISPQLARGGIVRTYAIHTLIVKVSFNSTGIVNACFVVPFPSLPVGCWTALFGTRIA
jgi:hypothetical protein